MDAIDRPVAAGSDGGRPRDVGQQRDLAEAVASTERPNELAVHRHVEVPVGNGEDAVATSTLAHNHCTVRDGHLGRTASHRFELGRRKRLERWDSTKQAHRDDRHIGDIVSGTHPPPDDHQEHGEEDAETDQGGIGATKRDEPLTGERSNDLAESDDQLEDTERCGECGRWDRSLQQHPDHQERHEHAATDDRSSTSAVASVAPMPPKVLSTPAPTRPMSSVSPAITTIRMWSRAGQHLQAAGHQ